MIHRPGEIAKEDPVVQEEGTNSYILVNII